MRYCTLVSLMHFLLLLVCYCSATWASVYPNYHTEYDFVTWNSKYQEKENAKKAAALKWWQTASFYQIYPRSFKDSNGDGVGDLNGIIERMDYLKEIGITATWLSPIFTSPMADFGYDIANYTEIAPIFGNMSDFDRLIAKAKSLDLKILLDFVPNHSSDECEWFRQSAAGNPDFKDFYVWHPGKIVNGVREPPTNWRSVFRGSAWQWNDNRKAYYLHQFVSKQPDLNYRNPKVREAMQNVLRFWLAKGVSGFRIDAIPHIFEIAADSNGNWPDEPRNNAVNDPDDYNYLQHIYTVNQPETINLLYEWRSVLDEFQKEHGGDERVLMAESYSPIDIEMKYYGNATAEGTQIPFNFWLIMTLNNGTNAYGYADTVNLWLSHMPAGRTANWLLGNHDQNRVGSRLGTDHIDMLNILTATLPGCNIAYQGEEIGMTDVWISWNDTVDPSACNSNPDVYEKLSRDPERTPFQWNDKLNAGFSTANKTWLPVSSNYIEVNVERERKLPLSHLNIFKQLRELRRVTTLQIGNTEVKALNGAVIGVRRFLLNDFTYLTLLNIFDGKETFNLHDHFNDLPEELEYIVITDRSKAKVGDLVNSTDILLQAKEAIVLRSTTKLTTSFGYYGYYPTASSTNNGVNEVVKYSNLIFQKKLKTKTLEQ